MQDGSVGTGIRSHQLKPNTITRFGYFGTRYRFLKTETHGRVLPDYNCSCSKLHLTLLLLFAKVVFVEAGVAAGHSFFGYLFGQKGGLGREYGTMRFQPECWLSTRMLIVNAIVDGQYALFI